MNDDLATLLHPWTCRDPHPDTDGGWPCRRAAADVEFRLPPVDPLREPAQALIAAAEPDIAYEGEGFVDYLVPFDAVDALRTALAIVVVTHDHSPGPSLNCSDCRKALAEYDAYGKRA